MLTKSDITILMQQVDVTKAYDLLAMFKEAGKERIDIRTILDEAAPKIKDYGNHATCSITEFAAWMKVSRQTVYNWKDSNYLVFAGNKVNLPETLDLWLSLPWLGSK